MSSDLERRQALYKKAYLEKQRQKEKEAELVDALKKAGALDEGFQMEEKSPRGKRGAAKKKAELLQKEKAEKKKKSKKKTGTTGIKFSKKTGRAIRNQTLKGKRGFYRQAVVGKIYEHNERIAYDPKQDLAIHWNEKNQEFEMRGEVQSIFTNNPMGSGGYKPGFSASKYKRGNPDMPDRLTMDEAIDVGVNKGRISAKAIAKERDAEREAEEQRKFDFSELSSLSPEELLMIKAAAKVEAIIRTARFDKAFFIEEFVRIEDKDAPEPMVPFALWPKQKEALEAFDKYKLTITLKARQLGMSWLALAYAVHGLVFQPGYSVVALSKREDEAKELVRRVKLILEYLPPFIIRKKDKNLPEGYDGPTWDATTTYIQIYHPESKVPSMFTSFTSSPDSARSFTASLVILDEWAFQMYAQEIWAAAYPVINRPTGGKVIGISTAKIGSFFEDVWKKAMKGRNNFHPIFLPWYSDPRRSQKWYEDTKEELPASYLQEYPATPEEAFSAGEATAFPEFDSEIHVCEPFDIPEHWRKWLSVDNGYDHPFCWLWFAVNEDGDVYVYREYTREKDDPKVLYTEQAFRVAELSTNASLRDGDLYIVPEDLDFCAAGLDAWNTHHRDTSGKTLIDYYRDGGVKQGFKKPITDRRLRKAVVHEYLKVIKEGENKRSKLKIFNTCKHLISTLPQLPKDNNDPEKVADCSIDNQYDSLSYGLVTYHVEKSAGLGQETPLIRKHKDAIAKKGNRRVRRRQYA